MPIEMQVDASQGVQAQSISVFHNARERGLKIIPVLNKVGFRPTKQRPAARNPNSTDVNADKYDSSRPQETDEPPEANLSGASGAMVW